MFSISLQSNFNLTEFMRINVENLVNYPSLTEGLRESSSGIPFPVASLPLVGSHATTPYSRNLRLLHTNPYGLSSLTAFGRYCTVSSEYLNLPTLAYPSILEGSCKQQRDKYLEFKFTQFYESKCFVDTCYLLRRISERYSFINKFCQSFDT